MGGLLNLVESQLQTDASIITATSTDAVNASGCQTLGFQIQATVPAAKTFDSGKSEVTTLTFPAKAASTAGDYVVIYDTAGLGWAVAVDKTGSDPAPTGAIWTAIPAGRKAQANITAATDAASVAAIFELAFDALTSVPFATDDTAADGTMLVTVTLRGPTTDAVVKNADDSGAGSIAAVVSTEGVTSEVDVSANTVSIPSHGYFTGFEGRLTTTGTLPGGLATATDYYVIVVDTSTIKFASSRANALLGTAIDITNQGTDAAVNTFTGTALSGGSVKIQKSLDNSIWVDEGSATNITATANVILAKVDPEAKFYKLLYAVSAGAYIITSKVLGKGPA